MEQLVKDKINSSKMMKMNESEEIAVPLRELRFSTVNFVQYNKMLASFFLNKLMAY